MCDYLTAISRASNKYGDKLLKFMDLCGVNNTKVFEDHPERYEKQAVEFMRENNI